MFFSTVEVKYLEKTEKFVVFLKIFELGSRRRQKRQLLKIE